MGDGLKRARVAARATQMRWKYYPDLSAHLLERGAREYGRVEGGTTFAAYKTLGEHNWKRLGGLEGNFTTLRAAKLAVRKAL